MLIAVCQYRPDDMPQKDLQFAKITDRKNSPYVTRWFRQRDGKLNDNINEFTSARGFQEQMGNTFYLELKYD